MEKRRKLEELDAILEKRKLIEINVILEKRKKLKAILLCKELLDKRKNKYNEVRRADLLFLQKNIYLRRKKWKRY